MDFEEERDAGGAVLELASAPFGSVLIRLAGSRRCVSTAGRSTRPGCQPFRTGTELGTALSSTDPMPKLAPETVVGRMRGCQPAWYKRSGRSAACAIGWPSPGWFGKARSECVR